MPSLLCISWYCWYFEQRSESTHITYAKLPKYISLHFLTIFNGWMRLSKWKQVYEYLENKSQDGRIIDNLSKIYPSPPPSLKMIIGSILFVKYIYRLSNSYDIARLCHCQWNTKGQTQSSDNSILIDEYFGHILRVVYLFSSNPNFNFLAPWKHRQRCSMFIGTARSSKLLRGT